LRIGGASRDRTDDLIVANDALSQLSYSPLRWEFLFDFTSRDSISPKSGRNPILIDRLDRQIMIAKYDRQISIAK